MCCHLFHDNGFIFFIFFIFYFPLFFLSFLKAWIDLTHIAVDTIVGRRANHPVTSIPPASRGKKDYGRIA